MRLQLCRLVFARRLRRHLFALDLPHHVHQPFVNHAQLHLRQRPFILPLDVLEDDLLAIRFIDWHSRVALQLADFVGALSALVQQLDERAIQVVDLPAQLRNIHWLSAQVRGVSQRIIHHGGHGAHREYSLDTKTPLSPCALWLILAILSNYELQPLRLAMLRILTQPLLHVPDSSRSFARSRCQPRLRRRRYRPPRTALESRPRSRRQLEVWFVRA